MTAETSNCPASFADPLAERPARRAGRRGFTMTELLVVAAIIAAFAAILFVVMGKVYKVVRSWD